MPYYCAQDYGVVRLIYDRKIAVFSSVSDRKRPVNDAVLIDLGMCEENVFECGWELFSIHWKAIEKLFFVIY